MKRVLGLWGKQDFTSLQADVESWDHNEARSIIGVAGIANAANMNISEE